MFHDSSNVGDQRAGQRYSDEHDNNTERYQNFSDGAIQAFDSLRASTDISSYQEENDLLETANVWSEASTSEHGYYKSLEDTMSTMSNSTAAWMLRQRKRTNTTVVETETNTSRPNKNSTHRRHATEGHVSAESSYSRASAISHPLQSHLQSAFTQSESALGLDLDATVTRPTLRRLLSAGEFADTHASVVESEDSGNVEENSVEVIVHEVSAADSFAGVALRYGISVSDLRRVNQLWTSDSIHLRKVLYIPIGLLVKGKRKSKNTNDNASNITRGGFSGGAGVNGPIVQRNPTDEVTYAQKSPVRRIPISQLAFFPRSTQMKSQLQGRLEAADRQTTTHAHLSPSISTPNGRPSQRGSALSTLFNALPHPLPLPIPLFAEDSRHSLDSNSLQSSLSTESENPLTQTHEMDVLRPQTETIHFRRQGSSKRLYIGRSTDSEEEGNFGETYVLTPRQRRKRSTSLPRGRTRDYRIVEDVDEGSTAPTAIRTEQLQPSPDMRFPRH